MSCGPSTALVVIEEFFTFLTQCTHFPAHLLVPVLLCLCRTPDRIYLRCCTQELTFSLGMIGQFSRTELCYGCCCWERLCWCWSCPWKGSVRAAGGQERICSHFPGLWLTAESCALLHLHIHFPTPGREQSSVEAWMAPGRIEITPFTGSSSHALACVTDRPFVDLTPLSQNWSSNKTWECKIFVQISQIEQKSCWGVSPACSHLVCHSSGKQSAVLHFLQQLRAVHVCSCTPRLSPTPAETQGTVLRGTPGSELSALNSAPLLGTPGQGCRVKPREIPWMFPLPGEAVTRGLSLQQQEEEEDEAGESSLATSWDFSICFFSLLHFLKFKALDSVWHFFLKLSSALSIVTVNKDLISSIIYMFPSFCPPYPQFKRMLIGLPVKKCYIAASALR